MANMIKHGILLMFQVNPHGLPTHHGWQWLGHWMPLANLASRQASLKRLINVSPVLSPPQVVSHNTVGKFKSRPLTSKSLSHAVSCRHALATTCLGKSLKAWAFLILSLSLSLCFTTFHHRPILPMWSQICNTLTSPFFALRLRRWENTLTNPAASKWSMS